jgi:hypothetical protein
MENCDGVSRIFFFKMTREDFENLICLVGPAVNKKRADVRNAISVTELLAIAL